MSELRAPIRPALRYHGGKWMLAPWVIEHFPAHRTYTESFGGAGSVLGRKPRSFEEIYNDLDGEIVNVFRVLRDPHQASRLAELLRLTPFARSEWRLAYESATDPVERARRVMVRSQMGFGSDSCNANRGTGFRFTAKRRRGTTPATDWARYPDSLKFWTDRLRGVTIECKPAVEVLRDHDSPQTCHYVDPPYVPSTRTDPGRGYACDMGEADHRGLAEALKGLGGSVVLSGYRCELYDELYADWDRVDRPVVVFRGARRTECLWLNPRAARARAPRLFD